MKVVCLQRGRTGTGDGRRFSMEKDPFKEYIRQSEPDMRDKGYVWHTAIGLQAVDGLSTSKYPPDYQKRMGA